MSTTITGTHPFADRFPMLPEDELQRLAEDIAENGLQNPVVLDAQGRILDGRNRDAACQRINVTPDVEVYDGDNPAAFVLSQNVARRHLSTGQQAMSTALVLVDDGHRSEGRWARGSVPADTSGSGSRQWAQRMAEAGTILDHAPDLADAVVSGDLALDAAYRQAEQRRDAERQRLEREERIAAEEADARAFVEESAPDLAELVGDTLQSYSEARAVWEKRNREEAARLAAEKAERERAAKADRDNEVQEVSTVAGALIRLEHLQHADRRAYARDCFDKHLAEVPPVQRDCHTPEFITALAGWLNTYAAELKENQR
jgi:hypothetical protein